VIADAWKLLVAASMFIAIAWLIWAIASVIETWRYERARRPRRPFGLRIRFRRPRPLPSNVYRFPERNRPSVARKVC
jgi:hypothetical protein